MLYRKKPIHRTYKASITREPFLFYEMRTTARLLADGLSEAEVIQRIVKENLYQYPTERSLKRMASACVRRLKGMHNDQLIAAVAAFAQDEAKQICLYAMMKEHRLISDFMLTVIGEKYRTQDDTFGRIDVNVYFNRLQAQDDGVATWSDSTIQKLKGILIRILVYNGYLDNMRATRLNPVLIGPLLEQAIRSGGDTCMLPVFHCFT